MSSDSQELTEASVRKIGGNRIGREGIPTDSPSLQITTVKLEEQIIIPGQDPLFHQSKGEACSDILLRLKEKSLLYDKWIAENSLVMSWLLHLMLPSIVTGYMLLTRAHEILNAVSKTYLQLAMMLKCELKKKKRETRQGERSLVGYYAVLRSIW